jgi:hydroxymethylpyrimidine pyrophosphatase-like HAD family hydrolase
LERIYYQRFGDQVNYCHTLKEMLEVMPKGVSKLSALRHLADYQGVDLSAVMSFGDGDNDAEMLAACGLGVAVANASPLAKSSADLTVASCDHNGPAAFLHALMDRAG